MASDWWNPNRQKEKQVTYTDGKEEGLETLWEEDGKVVDQVRYKNGVVIEE